MHPDEQPAPGHPQSADPQQLVAIPQPTAQGQPPTAQVQQPTPGGSGSSCYEITHKPRSIKFQCVKYVFITVIAIRLIIFIVFIATHSQELDSQLNSTIKRDKFRFSSVIVPIILYVAALFGSICESYNLALSMALTVGFNLVISTISTVIDKDMFSISSLVLDVIVFSVASYYAYLIKKEGGSACKYCLCCGPQI